ncbi:sulfur transferase domain-containing protein [Marinobacter sp. AC-23]|uniref:beta-lactamase hydrolase domain-containing protein n=1 Tax=Marinobacter sp. AC-23 TaxID=1879031 RepID=UPI000A73FDEC|nr:sulfur transferase domain-containing protein [Marinobacter sp. AC-23]
MDIKKIDDQYSVMAQPGIDDIEQLANAGFRTIIASRPRNETDDQPDTETLKTKAESLGITWREIPVEPGKYAPEDIEAFARALQSSTDPVLSYCRTGKRAITCGPMPMRLTIRSRTFSARPVQPALTWSRCEAILRRIGIGWCKTDRKIVRLIRCTDWVSSPHLEFAPTSAFSVPR